MTALGRKHQHPERVHANPSPHARNAATFVLALILLIVGWTLWSYLVSGLLTAAARSLS